ncbi:MAG: hypothetical protein Q9216_001964 [Gyalolechia sp. 2 TL-2023]
MDSSMVPPAGSPPGGVTPNYVNPPTLEDVTIGIGVLMIVLTALVVSARLYTNFFLSRSPGIEDYSCISAVVFLYTYVGLVFYLNRTARHIWDLPSTWLDAAFFKQRFARDMFISPATFFSKATIFLLYLRLFRPTKWFRYSIYVLMTSMIAVYGAYIIVNAALCAPAPGQSWSYPGVLAKCQKQEIYTEIQGTFNVIIDILALTLPMPIIRRMSLPMSKKIGILAIFGTGFIALICSILSLAYRAKLFGTEDWSWIGAENYITIIVEVGITIICSCAPALFTLGKHLFRNSSLFATFRSHTTVTHRKYPSGRHTIPTPTSSSRYSSNTLVRPQQSNHKRRSEGIGYVELGEVMSDTDRKITGAAFGFDLDGNRPPPVRKDPTGILRTTDVEIISWKKGDEDGEETEERR